MRKKYVAIVAALILGMIFGSVETVAMAGQDDGELGNVLSDEEGTVSGGNAGVMKGEDSEEGENSEKVGEQEGKVSGSSKNAAIISLWIPQKLEVIIDPWELDGKGQIYSEQYAIQNVGDVAGILTLAFLCRTQENSGVIVRQEKEGLHDDENKAIYIELKFGDGNKIILSQEKSEYQVELKPGEEVSFYFMGEVNENVPEQWRDDNIVIEGSYSWNIAEEMLTDADGVEEVSNFSNDIGESGEEFTVSGNDVLGNY